MPNQLVAKKTSVSSQDMFTALGTAWEHYLHSNPTMEQLCILVAQFAFETGWGSSMFNYNIGNAKSRDGDGRDYTFYECNEILDSTYAQKLSASQPANGRVEIRSSTGNKSAVWFYPEHPFCRFRAFTSLALGAVDYLDLIINHFGDVVEEKNAWSKVIAADVVGFCHALKLKGYYTDGENDYTTKVSAIYKTLLLKKFDMSQIPVFSDSEQEQLKNWVIAGSTQAIEDDIADREDPTGL